MTETQRNFLILVVIAVVGVTVSGGSGGFEFGTAAVMQVLNILFAIAILAFLVLLYQRNSGTIALMPSTPRLVLQGACALMLVVLVTGRTPIPPMGWGIGNPIAFWGAVFACGFAIWWAWQQRTTRW